MPKKIDYKKISKMFYNAKQNSLMEVEIPNMQFIMINGVGDPNHSVSFQKACDILFTVSYKIKFSVKKNGLGIDYSVFPLEALWWVEQGEFNLQDKKNWQWTLMIRQPELVTERIYFAAVEEVCTKKEIDNLANLSFKAYKEGRCIQTLHVGPYTAEQKTIDELHTYIKEKGYQFNGKHHEIYLNNPKNTASEKLRTIIRQPIK